MMHRLQTKQSAHPFTPFALRDSAVLIITLGFWALSPNTGSGTWITGGLTVLSGFLFHEWGHWLGARLSGATIYAPRTLLSPFLYNFDAEQNSREQFLATSLLGFAASGIFLFIFFFVLPAEHGATRIAQYGGLVLASLTVVFEFPIAILVAIGKKTPDLRLFKDQRSSN